jgi:stage II sporulation protein M
MKKQKEKTLKEIYSECWGFIKESKKQIYFAIGVFLLFALVGFFAIPPQNLELILIQKLKEISEMFSGLGTMQTIWLIFTNNLFVCFLVIFLGILFGIFPFLTLISNGYIIGYVAQKAVAVDGILVLWKLLPHGIFELPAILISAGIGFKLGTSLFRRKEFLKNYKKAMLTFFLVIFLLLFIAAVIEGILVSVLN